MLNVYFLLVEILTVLVILVLTKKLLKLIFFQTPLKISTSEAETQHTYLYLSFAVLNFL
jgi:hypothetical protein